MAVSFNNLVNDSGNNTDGTLIDKAQFQLLLMGAVVASTSTGAQNNWAPGLDGHTLITWAGASDAAFTGMATGTAGQIAMIRNTGTKVGTFASLSGSSSAANQFTNSATSAPTPIAPGGWIVYRHDGTNWKLVGHEQGAWITPTFAAGNFTCSGAMTWTVAAGDAATMKYRLDGKTLTVAIELNTTTIGGTIDYSLRIGAAVYGNFATPYSAAVALAAATSAGTEVNGYAQCDVGGSAIRCIKKPLATWTAGTDNTGVSFVHAFEVT